MRSPMHTSTRPSKRSSGLDRPSAKSMPASSVKAWWGTATQIYLDPWRPWRPHFPNVATLGFG